MGSNKTASQGPGAARDASDAAQEQSETSTVAPIVAASPAQDGALDFGAQPVASPPTALNSPPSPVVLPEISLPAFYLQSAVEPTGYLGQSARSRSSARMPCPTRGCSSREHQNA